MKKKKEVIANDEVIDTDKKPRKARCTVEESISATFAKLQKLMVRKAKAEGTKPEAIEPVNPAKAEIAKKIEELETAIKELKKAVRKI